MNFDNKLHKINYLLKRNSELDKDLHRIARDIRSNEIQMGFLFNQIEQEENK